MEYNFDDVDYKTTVKQTQKTLIKYFFMEC